MTMKNDLDRDLLDRMDRILCFDVFTEAFSDEDIDGMLRAMGADPSEIGSRGINHAQEMMDAQRLGWREVAAKRMERMKQAVARPMRNLSELTRDVLITLIQAAGEDRSTRDPVHAYFRKKRPEESTDEELRSILKQVEKLKSLSDLDLNNDQ